MKQFIAAFCLTLLGTSVALAAPPALDSLIDQDLPALVATYKTLHAAPELSGHEENTAAFTARELTRLGYEVSDHVGRYERSGRAALGVVALLKNGAGPVLLVRADLDALPVEEKTGLPYASKVKAKNDKGEEVCVMHACGHDVHVTCLLGAAKLLAQLRTHWHGTLMLVGQPFEEGTEGAQALLDDGLYTRFPRPNFALALHDSAALEAGTIGLCSGYALASSTSVQITVRGAGGHASTPEKTKDPIVAAAQLVLALQSIVSRENSPLTPAVVTIGSIHGGTRGNIIPDEVQLQLSIRAYQEEVRQKVLASIERIAQGVALAAGLPPDRPPIVTILPSNPATYNDPKLTAQLEALFVKTFGKDQVVQSAPVMAAEDFGRYSLEGHQIPACIFWLGAVDPAKVAASKKDGLALPALHSSLFAPLPEPTIRTGVKALTTAALDLLK